MIKITKKLMTIISKVVNWHYDFYKFYNFIDHFVHCF